MGSAQPLLTQKLRKESESSQLELFYHTFLIKSTNISIKYYKESLVYTNRMTAGIFYCHTDNRLDKMLHRLHTRKERKTAEESKKNSST